MLSSAVDALPGRRKRRSRGGGSKTKGALALAAAGAGALVGGRQLRKRKHDSAEVPVTVAPPAAGPTPTVL